MRSRLDPVEKKLAKFLEDWLIMQQEMYGSQRMWGIEGDTKAADIFAWLLENGRCLDRDLENTEKLKSTTYYEPQMKECYHNALLMRSDGLAYWEGWMVGEQIPIPIEHAWNVYEGKVIDFTSTLWGRDDEKRIYFGVEIPYEWLWEKIVDTGVSGPYLYQYVITQMNETSNSLSAEEGVFTMNQSFGAESFNAEDSSEWRAEERAFLNAEDFEAESRFDELQDKVARQYEDKGYSKEEAMKIGGSVAYDAGVKKYGKKGMERLAKRGRERATSRRERKARSKTRSIGRRRGRAAKGMAVAAESSNSLSTKSMASDNMSNGLSNYEAMDSIIQEAPLGHGVAQDFGTEHEQGYDDRDDESIGMRHRGKHKQSLKDRRDESKGMERSMGHRPYSDVGTMDMNAQGYDDRLDESLGMSHRESGMSQSRKSRRDESKGMEKALGNRPYSRVGTMDEPQDFEAKYRVRDKRGDYWYKDSKTGANIKKLNKNRVLGNDRVRKAKRIPMTKANRRMYGHVGDFGLKGNMAETHAAEGDFKTGFQYGAGATVGVVSAVVITGFLIQGVQSLFNRD